MKKQVNINKRPQNWSELIGQDHLKPLFKNIVKEKDDSSLIFYGHSGIGKTSTAILLATLLKKTYDIFNPSLEDKKTLITKLKNNEILIIDEIHAMNKDKQDILLPLLENKKNIIYATTTENPYFTINPALRSRMKILNFEKISFEKILLYFKKMTKNNLIKFKIDKNNIYSLISCAQGDLRIFTYSIDLLNKLYVNKNVTEKELKVVIPDINFFSDKKGDEHYNNLSAFHKSLRGSDVDAALYYGSLIIKSGDIQGLFRRMINVAYEDISLANSIMGIKVESAIKAYERLGLPEGYNPLGFIICELALSPKSNSTYLAMHKANELIDSGKVYDIPNHLKDSHYKSAKKLGRGKGYKYPHNFENNYVDQQYLPEEIKTKIFEFGRSINEQKIENYWKKIKNYSNK